jgi:hypothetical protein
MAPLRNVVVAVLTLLLSSRCFAEDGLAEQRRQRGQDPLTGGPFYESTQDFDDFVAAVKAMEAGSTIDRTSVKELHESFLISPNRDVWDAWGQVCVVVEALSNIRGCIDAPSGLTGRRATHHAAMAGNVEKLSWLAARDANFDAVTGPNTMNAKQTGFSPAHLAALTGQLPALELLERGGADLFHRAPGGFTPLDVALEKGHGVIVSFLQSKAATRAEL